MAVTTPESTAEEEGLERKMTVVALDLLETWGMAEEEGLCGQREKTQKSTARATKSEPEEEDGFSCTVVRYRLQLPVRDMALDKDPNVEVLHWRQCVHMAKEFMIYDHLKLDLHLGGCSCYHEIAEAPIDRRLHFGPNIVLFLTPNG
ncbi:hypothetical protein GUJ93_ZPchr0013g35807 [Zizania palustris]|uniref:Uncharacterized protein n=1 Tax=Zizania palustris TaxID=103762 RepID=A0A8J5X4N2_ZIZPA|nr:hypothetical protein GUJ93_ZPchr0013g35807 [Zizania palustris]